MSEKIEKKIETAKSFERQLYAENERSKKNAWRVAVAASLLSLCLGAAICVLVPLKEKELAIVAVGEKTGRTELITCLLYTSPSPRDGLGSRMPSSA